ncbi:hypothetical protein [Symmachiella dynata]|uniref:hypothetical protein n=1 Tax=Symmachiella dynata TaxID=2527995 RepID=UPI0030EE4A9D
MSNEKFTYAFPNGSTVELPAPVLDVVVDGGQHYIIFDSDPPETITDNVLCHNEDGMLLWRIEDILPDKPNMFGQGRLRRDGTLEFWNTDGVWIQVNKATGQAIGFRIEKMGPLSEHDDHIFEPIFWRE